MKDVNAFFPKEHYTQIIEKEYNRYENYRSQLEGLETLNNAQRVQASNLAVRASFILYLMYSAGYTKERLREQLHVVLSDMQKHWDPNIIRMVTGRAPKQIYHPIYYLEIYISLRWTLSFAVLLDTPKEKFLIFKTLIDRDKIEDAIYDTCLSFRFPDRKIARQLALKKPSNRILEILHKNDQEQAANEILTYLDKEWLKTYNNQALLAGAHRDKTYFPGYWAFEVAAIVKVKSIDDSLLKEHP